MRARRGVIMVLALALMASWPVAEVEARAPNKANKANKPNKNKSKGRATQKKRNAKKPGKSKTETLGRRPKGSKPKSPKPMEPSALGTPTRTEITVKPARLVRRGFLSGEAPRIEQPQTLHVETTVRYAGAKPVVPSRNVDIAYGGKVLSGTLTVHNAGEQTPPSDRSREAPSLSALWRPSRTPSSCPPSRCSRA